LVQGAPNCDGGGVFVPTRWRGYLEQAAADGDVAAYRHYWELCVLLALRDGLRCGDVFVPGSRRYADPASYLLTPAQWEPKRAEFCALVEKSPDPEAVRERFVPLVVALRARITPASCRTVSASLDHHRSRTVFL
jgi:hypothetical protein